jgi:hypothetical protein
VGFRDRFLTPTTARAIMSWRSAVGVALAVALVVGGVPIWVAILFGAGVAIGLVLAAMPKARSRPAVDPFMLSEPWRQLMQDAQGSGRRIRQLVEDMDDGPLRDTLRGISSELDHGLDEAWAIARRGDEIDEMIRNLDRPRLRSRLATLRRDGPAGDDATTAIASLERQIAAADRLDEQSARTVAELRTTQSQLDELVVRVTEIRGGAADTESYAHQVDELVIKLEALHQAVQETRPA